MFENLAENGGTVRLFDWSSSRGNPKSQMLELGGWNSDLLVEEAVQVLGRVQKESVCRSFEMISPIDLPDFPEIESVKHRLELSRAEVS